MLASPRLGAVTDVLHVHWGQELAALHYGWYAVERQGGRCYRWMASHGSVVVRLSRPARRMTMGYRMSTLPVGGVEIEVRPLTDTDVHPVPAAFIPHRDASSRRETLKVDLPAGDYAIRLSAPRCLAWGPRDLRELTLALSSLTFSRS